MLVSPREGFLGHVERLLRIGGQQVCGSDHIRVFVAAQPLECLACLVLHRLTLSTREAGLPLRLGLPFQAAARNGYASGPITETDAPSWFETNAWPVVAFTSTSVGVAPTEIEPMTIRVAPSTTVVFPLS